MNEIVETSKCVIIADDDPGIRQVMRAALQKDGFTVIDVDDGDLVADAFERHKPCLVLLDVEMPRQDGFKTCEQIRGLDNGKNVPIVMATGREDLNAVNQAYQAGATEIGRAHV